MDRKGFLKLVGALGTVAVAGLLSESRVGAQVGLSYINVMDFGAKGDGRADDTAAISAAFDAGNKTDRVIYFPPGIYKCGVIDKPYGVTIRSNGATILSDNTSWYTWSFRGWLAAPVALRADTVKGSNKVVVNTGGISAGDLIFLRDETPITSVDPTRKVGQTLKVKSVDSDTQLSTTEPIYHAFATTQKASMQKVEVMPGRLDIQGLRFKNPNPANPVGFVAAYYGVNTRIVLEGKDAATAGIQLFGCYGFHVDSQAETYAYDSATGRYGYGVQIMNGSAHGTVYSNSVDGNNAFTTGSDGYGEPYDLEVHVHNVNSSTVGLSTHPAGHDIRFVRPKIFNATTHAMEIRNQGTTIIEPQVTQPGTRALYTKENGGKDLTVKGGTLTGGTRGYEGIFLQDPVSNLHFEGVTVEDSFRNGIFFNSEVTNARIVANTFRNFGKDGAAGAQKGIAFNGLVRETLIHRNIAEDDQIIRTSQFLFGLPDLENVDVAASYNTTRNGIALRTANSWGLTEVNNN